MNNRNDAARPARALALVAPALIALSLGTLTACGGSADRTASSATTAPTSAPPVVDDSSFTVVPPNGPPPVGSMPEPTEPSVDAPAPDAAVAPDGSVAAPAEGAAAGSTNGAVSGTGATTRTTPGLADGATALPPTATVAPDGRCSVTALKLEPLDLQGSPGGTYANFRLRNVSPGVCAVRGLVGATLIDDAGKALPTTVKQEAGPEQWVRIARGGSAQFHLRFPNPYSGDSPCNPPNAASVRVTLPGATGALTGPSPEGGIQACRGEVSTAPIGST